MPSSNVEFSSSIAADADIRQFISAFFKISDDPTKNDEWVDYFLPEAVLVMGNDTAEGQDAIRALRPKMWEKVASRDHTPLKVFEGSFPAAAGGADGKEYMVFGDLVYALKTGETQNVSWTAHAILRKEGERLKFVRYRVWIQR